MLLAGECAIVVASVWEKSSRVEVTVVGGEKSSRVEVTVVGGGFLSDSGTVRLVLK